MSGWLPGEKPDISEKEIRELWKKYKILIVDDSWMCKVHMPTDWLVEVRAMCRKPPFRLRGEMVLKRD